MSYTPHNWYWLHDDGRIYSSAAQSLVLSTDTAYEAWLASGFKPTGWPSDLAGNQTYAALQEVVGVFGITADLAGYVWISQAARLAKGVTVNVGASGTPVPVLCDGLSSTRADLALLALFGQTAPTATKAWIDNNGVVSVLTGTELIALATLVGIWIDDCYGVIPTILSGIAAGTITTPAQIDTAFAAVTA